MFGKTVTFFCLHDGQWYPRVFHDAQVSRDRGYITRTYGQTASETVAVHIKRKGGKAEGLFDVYEPKAWKELLNVSGTIAFNTGDIIWLGEYDDVHPIEDDSVPGGFLSHFRNEHDCVYTLTQVADYTEIPHWEIAGR